MPSQADKPYRLTIQLDRDLVARFELAAKANHRTMAGEVRRLVEGRVESFEAEIARAA